MIPHYVPLREHTSSICFWLAKTNTGCNRYHPPYIPPLIRPSQIQWETYGVTVKNTIVVVDPLFARVYKEIFLVNRDKLMEHISLQESSRQI
ncbi:hypothetical protein PN496_09730 [Nodularia spumigena CS-1038]|nr:hypothetical protein [Nodularia spumigena CS-1038]